MYAAFDMISTGENFVSDQKRHPLHGVQTIWSKNHLQSPADELFSRFSGAAACKFSKRFSKSTSLQKTLDC